MIYALIYLIGFLVNLLFFVKFGKRCGIDYDAPKDYVNHDDWNSNAEAYTAFSFMWPILNAFLLLAAIWKLSVNLTGKIISIIGTN